MPARQTHKPSTAKARSKLNGHPVKRSRPELARTTGRNPRRYQSRCAPVCRDVSLGTVWRYAPSSVRRVEWFFLVVDAIWTLKERPVGYVNQHPWWPCPLRYGARPYLLLTGEDAREFREPAANAARTPGHTRPVICVCNAFQAGSRSGKGSVRATHPKATPNLRSSSLSCTAAMQCSANKTKRLHNLDGRLHGL